MDTLRAYGKALAAGLAALIALLQTQNTDDGIDTGEKLLLVAAFAGAVLVFGTTNPGLPFWRYTKALTEIVAGVAGYLALEWTNGAADLTTSQWVTIAVIGAGAVGVLLAPGPTWPVNPPPVIEAGPSPISQPHT